MEDLTQAQLEKLEEILKKIDAYETLGGDVPTTKEVVDLVATIIQVVKEAKEFLEKQAIDNKKDLNSLVNRLTEQEVQKIAEALNVLEKKTEKVIKSINEKTKLDLDSITKNLYLELPKLRSLIPKEADFTEIYDKIKEVESKIVPETNAEKIRDKIESLEGDKRLDKKAIKDLDEELIAIRNLPRGGIGGVRGFQLYTDGTKRGQVSMINIIPGTGVSLAYSQAFGRNDITISASASSSILDFTGTVDDSNVTFTTTAEPTIVVINGASYRATGGAITWLYLAGVVTLSSPVGQGGNLYGIS